MTNKQVAQLFISGNPARAGHIRTDGNDLFSYNLKIGETRGAQKVVFNYTRSGRFFSQTTSKHVRLAEQCGAKLIEVGE
jgi:intein-encoded DNA endonuclease-like protein